MRKSPFLALCATALLLSFPASGFAISANDFLPPAQADSPQAWADVNPALDFLTARGVSQNQAAALVSSSQPYKGCFSSSGHLFCLIKEKYPNLAKNPVAAQALANGNALRVKNLLYQELIKSYHQNIYQDANLARASLVDVMQRYSGPVPTRGVEFASYRKDNWLVSIAAIKDNRIAETINAFASHKDLKQTYCLGLYRKAEMCIANGKYQEALAALKEIHDLRYSSFSAYLTVIQAFMKAGQQEDAKRLANELLAEYRDKMDANQAESLGNLFLELGQSDKAELVFGIAMQRNRDIMQ